jgi:hypothetical protein
MRAVREFASLALGLTLVAPLEPSALARERARGADIETIRLPWEASWTVLQYGPPPAARAAMKPFRIAEYNEDGELLGLIRPETHRFATVADGRPVRDRYQRELDERYEHRFEIVEVDARGRISKAG